MYDLRCLCKPTKATYSTPYYSFADAPPESSQNSLSPKCTIPDASVGLRRRRSALHIIISLMAHGEQSGSSLAQMYESQKRPQGHEGNVMCSGTSSVIAIQVGERCLVRTTAFDLGGGVVRHQANIQRCDYSAGRSFGTGIRQPIDMRSRLKVRLSRSVFGLRRQCITYRKLSSADGFRKRVEPNPLQSYVSRMQ